MKTQNVLMLITGLVLLNCSVLSAAEPKVSLKFGKGLNVVDADSSVSFNMSVLMQNRIDVAKTFEEGTDPFFAAQVRRLRLSMKGFAFTPKLEYNIQLGFSPADVKSGILFDANIVYTPIREFAVAFGQGKLPGNREEVISDIRQQFIEKSTTSTLFKLERDFGVQVRTELGNKVITRGIASISTGEGRNYNTPGLQNFDYTFRGELLPLGKFTDKGDYAYVDLAREEKPKLSIGASYDLNTKAIYSRGQTGGDVVPDSVGKSNINTTFADMIFKYKGMTVAGDYAYRFVKDNVNPYTGKNIYTAGQSFFVSAGYICKKNFESVFRFTRSFPGSEGTIPEINEYTLGMAYYVSNHNLKILTDYTLFDNKDTNILSGNWRMQLQINI